MRTLLTTHYLPPHRGGIEVLTADLARCLASGGDRVSLVTSRIPADAPEESELFPGGPRIVRVSALDWAERFGQVPYPILAPGAAGRALAREAAGGKAVDVVHSQGILYAASAAAARFARRNGLPFCATEYVGEIPYPDPLRRFVQRLAFRTRGASVARRADLLLLATPRLLRQAEEWTGGATPVDLLPSGLDAALFRPAEPGERERLRREWELPDDRVVVLFVGRPTPRKGLPILEAALAGMEPAPLLVVAGTAPAADENRERRRSFEAVPRERLAGIYRAADLFVLPSTGEGFPVAAQEALLSGLPVLLAEDPAYAAAVEPGWIDTTPPEAGALREGIRKLLGGRDGRRRELLAARPRMEARWSLEANAERHREAWRAAGFFRRARREWSFARLDLSADAKLPILRKFLSPLPARGLDVGTGTGWGAATLLGPRFFAVDRVMPNLLLARRKARAAGGDPRLVLADGSRLPFREGAFDAVLSSEVLEHLENDVEAAAELARVAAPGGRIVVSTPYSGLGFEGFLELAGVETVHRRPGPERHLRPGYTEESLDALFGPLGCRAERREFFLRPFGKLAADLVAGLHLAFERIVLGRREWTWSEASELDGSLPVRIYRRLFPLLALGNRLDRFWPGKGFQFAVLYRKGGAP